MATEIADARPDNMKRERAEHFADERSLYEADGAADASIVYEDDQVAVVADHTGHELNEWVSETDNITRDELSEWCHTVARDLCDYDWSASDPVVFDKREVRA